MLVKSCCLHLSHPSLGTRPPKPNGCSMSYHSYIPRASMSQHVTKCHNIITHDEWEARDPYVFKLSSILFPYVRNMLSCQAPGVRRSLANWAPDVFHGLTELGRELLYWVVAWQLQPERKNIRLILKPKKNKNGWDSTFFFKNEMQFLKIRLASTQGLGTHWCRYAHVASCPLAALQPRRSLRLLGLPTNPIESIAKGQFMG